MTRLVFAFAFAGAILAQTPVRTCESLISLSLPDTTFDSAAVAGPVCRVDATVAHPPAGDKVRIWVALPLDKWNGRFRGTGGGGFRGGNPKSLELAASGWAVAATDTGHEGATAEFAVDPQGRLNWISVRNFAYLGIHDMTVLGKTITAAFYGRPPRYSYFTGGSTGGRQALMEAQRYPADYDGIFSGAPGINMTRLHVAQMWGQLVMQEAGNRVPMCKFDEATQASITACDALDGVKDGVVDDPFRCKFDPSALVGVEPARCGRITAADADVIRKIWEGPRRRDGSFLWYGLTPGAPFGALNGPQTMGISLNWCKYLLKQDPQWTIVGLTRAGYEHMWDQSVEQYGEVIATDNPDLTAFHDRGGKLIVTHGWADQFIYAQGTIAYYNRVRERMGPRTGEFIRLFMMPGVYHGNGGPGPMAVDPVGALVKWVEEGVTPETLRAEIAIASGGTRSRPLCPYPLVARYKGSGSTDGAANFACVTDSRP